MVKKTTAITIGLTKLPSKILNLNHMLFNGDNILELIKPSIKKTKEITSDQFLTSPSSKTVQKAIIMKTIKKSFQNFYY